MSEISDILDFDPYKEDPDLNVLLNNHDFLKMSNVDPTMLISNDLNVPNHEIKKEKPVNEPFIISNEDYTGPYQFEIYVDPHHGNKSPWVYSGPLNKIFILNNQSFPIDFKWSGSENSELYIRATPMFGSSQFQHEIVSRCIPHAQATDTSNIGVEPHVWDHIIRCINPNTIYQGNKTDSRLSVIVPVAHYHSDTDRKMFKFVCKNSCPTGMNRRALEIIFTLEDVEGNILGRKVLNVRICSCPKRDKDKEEREFHRNNTENKSNCWPSQKKRKVEKKAGSSTSTHDLKVYEFSVKVVGKQNIKEVYKRVYDLMAGEAARNNIDQPYKEVMSEITQKLSE